MNTIRSTWYGWGALCGAGGLAYYLAKREINADRQARYENEIRRKERIAQLRQQKGLAAGDDTSTSSSSPKVADHAASSISQASSEAAPVKHAPETVDQAVVEKSKYEAAEQYRSRKGNRLS